jgi:hypothetical protein
MIFCRPAVLLIRTNCTLAAWPGFSRNALGGKTGTFEILMTEKPSIRLTFSASAH